MSRTDDMICGSAGWLIGSAAVVLALLIAWMLCGGGMNTKQGAGEVDRLVIERAAHAR